MAQIINIRKMRMNKNPDIFIETVLNDPARLARIREKQEKAREEARLKAEREQMEIEEREKACRTALAFSVGFSGVSAIGAALVALIF